jgi:starch phosphorylase
VIFLADYDMLLAERLVQGVDVWINTPRRPWEACGTSGMKVLVNGGHQPLRIGRLVGRGLHPSRSAGPWGTAGSTATIPPGTPPRPRRSTSLLEQEVIPEFYARNENGMPTAWVQRMRESMARLTPRFSANRAVREYTEQHYLPAAAAYVSRERAANKGADGKVYGRLAAATWTENGLGCASETCGSKPTGWTSITLRSKSFWMKSTRMRSGLSFMPTESTEAMPLREEMKRAAAPMRSGGRCVYHATGSSARTSELNDYTARVSPTFTGSGGPAGRSGRILWQR